MHGRVLSVSFAAKGIRRKKSRFNKYRLSISDAFGQIFGKTVRTAFFMRKKAGKA